MVAQKVEPAVGVLLFVLLLEVGRLLASLIQEELRQPEVAFFSGSSIELHQPKLDLFVARLTVALAGPEYGVNVVGVPDRDIEQRAFPGGFKMRGGGFKRDRPCTFRDRRRGTSSGPEGTPVGSRC